jgi:SAM-dependent methyltransferase
MNFILNASRPLLLLLLLICQQYKHQLHFCQGFFSSPHFAVIKTKPNPTSSSWAASTLIAFKQNTIASSPATANIVTSLWAAEQRIAEKVLANPKWPSEWPYTQSDFTRMDESNDSIFYSTPRLVTHIDDAAIQALTGYYASVFKDGEDVLDICSSWISHYPKEWKGGNVVGLGMNEYELSQNKALSSYNVQDLNQDPKFPYPDESFDKVTCVVSVDYLTKPREIFSEIGRVLRPGGMGILSISNRCFPTKAWNLWLRTNDLEHIFIAGSFFHYSGLFEPPTCVDVSPNPGRSDPMYIITAEKKKVKG